MAEFVQLKMEAMVPELEQMEKLLLFDRHEISEIHRKRKEFEYKLRRRTKRKEDYIHYIQFESDLLQEIRLRREKTGFQLKKGNWQIGNRVNALFEEVTKLFPQDVHLWISRIQFCKKMHFDSCIRRILQDMMNHHGDKPQLWKKAAEYELEANQSVEKAREFLMKGLRFHPNSPLLHAAAFKLELQFAAKIRAERDEQERIKKENESDAVAGSSKQDSEMLSADQVQVMEGHVAEILYESAMKKIGNDVTFVISLLNIAKEFEFTEKLQKKIVKDLLENFKTHELTWDTMARRELEGLHYTESEGESGPPVLVSSDADKGNYEKKRLALCVKVYKSRVKRIATERMWSLYIDTMLEINQDQSQLSAEKKEALKDALNGAHKAKKLQEKYYVHWAEMLQGAGEKEKLSEVLMWATERFPSSAELWHMRLRFYFSRDEQDAGEKVFNSAISHLGDNCEAVLPLWKILLQYCQTKSPEQTESYFQKGLDSPSVAVALRPLYLEWVTLSRGIVFARAAYDKISRIPPLSLGLHAKMIELEFIQVHPRLKQIRNCHENACNQFGQDNADVWMEYVKFELQRGDPQKVTAIHDRATRTLRQDLLDSFISEFSLQKLVN